MKIYVHAGSQFDFLFFVNYLIDKSKHDKIQRFRVHHRAGKLITISMRNSKITFVDSNLILTGSLKSLCNAFGVEDFKDNPFHETYTYEQLIDMDPDTEDKVEEYVLNDCIMLKGVMEKAAEAIKGVGSSLFYGNSTASIAYNT